MKGIRSVFSVDLVNKTFDPLIPVSALDLKVKEKDIQNWIAEKPELLLHEPRRRTCHRASGVRETDAGFFFYSWLWIARDTLRLSETHLTVAPSAS